MRTYTNHNVSKLVYHFVLQTKYWTAGYYVATVSEHGNEEVIANYVKNQGNEYKKLFRNKEPAGQLSIFDYSEGY